MARMLRLEWTLVILILVVLFLGALTGNRIDDAEIYRLNHSAWTKSE